jgi:hypothetical protein
VAWIFGFFGIATAIAALKAEERFFRVFLLCCCLLNLTALAWAVTSDQEFAFKLRPNLSDALERLPTPAEGDRA